MGRRFICFDAQYYLRRNYSVVKNNKDFNKYSLITSFLWTILKVSKMYPSDKILLLWDKRPYKKEEIIKNYKGSRYHVLDHENDLQKKLAAATTDEERSKIQAELDKIKLEADQFREFSSAKYEILTKFSNFGLASVLIPGYEADDLARLISLYNEENKDSTILVSGDSDWTCMANNNTDVFFYKSKNPKYFTQLESRLLFCKHGLDPFHFYQINDIYNGGHNDVITDTTYKKNYSIAQVIEKIKNNDVSDIEEVAAYYNALNVDQFLPEIKGKLWYQLNKAGTWNKSGWYAYHKEFNIGVYPNYYASIINKLNSSLFGGGNDTH